MALSAGTRLGPYEILGPLGAGGMGEVYRARDLRLKREVALKVLPEELAHDPERLERFEREAQTLAALNHPHIVTIYSVEEADELRFLTMELVEGETLGSVIPPAGLPLARFFQLAIPLSEAVSAAHEKGITHRDLKPANVMVTSEGRVKVLDFGLSKLGDATESADGSQAPTAHATEAGRVLGTAPYMSPEQVRGQTVDHRSDVFSLGIILYEMLTGERPFGGDHSADISSSILRDTPPSVLERKADLPRELGRVVKHCLVKEPRKRFQTALDLANELDELKKEVDTGEIRTSSGEGGRSSGNRGLWLAVAAVVAGLAVGFGYLSTRPAQESLPATTAAPERQMLVILPFENLGAPEDAYFAAGVTEEIASRLARVSGLGVISRTSATQYDRTGKTTKQIGGDLGVGYVLDGTVRWDHRSEGAGRVRITPQLIRVVDDTQLWADSYDRVLDDIFEAQSEIAQEVVEQLGVTLLPGEQGSVEGRPTESLEAYDLYLQGQSIRFLQGHETVETVQRAADRFRQATEKDPEFALGYAALAECYSYLASNSDFPKEELEQAVERALELDDTLPDAYVALGLLREIHDFDWVGAEEAFERAIELSPGLWNAHREYGMLLRRMGRYAEAVTQYERAYELDPISRFSGNNLAATLGLVGEHDRAIEIKTKLAALYPDQEWAHRDLALTYAEAGLFDQAFDELEKVQSSLGRLSIGGRIHALAGNTSEALRLVDELESSPELDAIEKGWHTARIHAGLGNEEEAFSRLERLDPRVAIILQEIAFMDPFRNDPRYAALLRRVGLKP